MEHPTEFQFKTPGGSILGYRQGGWIIHGNGRYEYDLIGIVHTVGQVYCFVDTRTLFDGDIVHSWGTTLFDQQFAKLIVQSCRVILEPIFRQLIKDYDGTQR
jgi:hypothetical protein